MVKSIYLKNKNTKPWACSNCKPLPPVGLVAPLVAAVMAVARLSLVVALPCANRVALVELGLLVEEIILGKQKCIQATNSQD